MDNFKICSNKNCIHKGEQQPLSNFHKDRSKKDGYRTDCIDCRKKYKEKNKENIQIKDKERYKIRRDKVLIQKKQYQNKFAKYSTYFDKLSLYEECRQDPDNPELLQVRCKYCNKWFNPTNLQTKHRVDAINSGFKNKVGESNFYCSDGCKHACPTYGQILYPKDFKSATSREVQPELRKLVLERDNWTCQKCGSNKEIDPDVELHCHHIDPVINNPIESADIDNCITLCKDCHKWVHQNIPGCGYQELKCSY